MALLLKIIRRLFEFRTHYFYCRNLFAQLSHTDKHRDKIIGAVPVWPRFCPLQYKYPFHQTGKIVEHYFYNYWLRLDPHVKTTIQRIYLPIFWTDYFNFNLGVVDEILDFQHSYMFYSAMRFSARENWGQYYGSGVQYLFHVSAAINHGNSGGPAINALGEAIGTNTWGLPGENVGYSVPTNFLKRSARDIIQHGRPITPWLGILCHPPEVPYKWQFLDKPLWITNEWNLWFDVEVDVPYIEHVNPYSPAYEAGIRKGDHILSVDNIRFTNVFELYKYILNKRIGDEVTLMIERNGSGLPPVTVELGEKKVRYDSVRIDSWSMMGPFYGYSDSYTRPYLCTLTY